MIYEKKYIQFNDFVFGLYDIVNGDDEPIQYKGSSTAYSYTHGSYRPLKNSYLYVSEKQVNMTITLNTKKLPCEQRLHYVKFFEQELGRPGRLWAIKNNELIWAFAAVNNIRPVKNHKQWQVVYDIEFVIPDGIWHKADKLKTFLMPYDPCLFMDDCKGFKDIDPCEKFKVMNEDCCLSCIEKTSQKAKKEDCSCCCDERVCNTDALCFHTDELQKFYGCDVPYRMVYDCAKGEEFFGDPYLGQKLCKARSCDGIIAGRLYSETDIPTEGVDIIITGRVKDVEIEINDNVNVIKGEYDGLRVTPSGDVYTKTECCETLLDPSVWSVPKGMNYGWTVNPRNNRIIIRTNTCCDRNCVYISDDAITT